MPTMLMRSSVECFGDLCYRVYSQMAQNQIFTGFNPRTWQSPNTPHWNDRDGCFEWNDSQEWEKALFVMNQLWSSDANTIDIRNSFHQIARHALAALVVRIQEIVDLLVVDLTMSPGKA